MTVHGLWLIGRTPPHINFLELKAVLLALQSFQPMLQGSTVTILSDNSTAVAYINKQGGMVSRSLCKLAIHLWDFCLASWIFPMATHVLGVNNSLADTLSRQTSVCHEWELNPKYFHLRQVFQCWGRPELDAFATKGNTKCALFCSRGGNDRTSLGDGLLYNWMGLSVYAFPPLPLIPQVVQKLLRQPCKMLLVIPWWPRQRSATLSLDSGTYRLKHRSITFSQRAHDTIQNSRKPSTRKSHYFKWLCFLRWLPEGHNSPETTDLPVVFDFLLHLVDCGLSHSSIRVYLSALSAYHTLVDGHSLFSHPLSKRFLRGLLLSHPPVKHTKCTWDLPLVLRCLTRHPFEPAATCDLRLLSMKTLFLVAITSARRVSELAALDSRTEFLSFLPNAVRLSTNGDFLPKMVSTFHLIFTQTLPTTWNVSGTLWMSREPLSFTYTGLTFLKETPSCLSLIHKNPWARLSRHNACPTLQAL